MTCQKAVVLEIRKSDTEVRMIDAVVICHVENFRVSFPDKREDKIVPRQVTMLMRPADSRGTEKVRCMTGHTDPVIESGRPSDMNAM